MSARWPYDHVDLEALKRSVTAEDLDTVLAGIRPSPLSVGARVHLSAQLFDGVDLQRVQHGSFARWWSGRSWQ